VALLVSGTIGILLGNGDGTLQQPTYTAGGIIGVKAADFNRDGRTDLAVLAVEPCSVCILPNVVRAILLSQPDGTLLAVQTEPHFFPRLLEM
jgi:FG-GAP-like repeat